MNPSTSVNVSDMTQSGLPDAGEEKRKMLGIFRDESGKCEQWNKKYIHGSMFLLGAGAYGSVFQVLTRLYSQGKQKIAKERYIYHPEFLKAFLNQRRIKAENIEKLADKYRDSHLLDVVAVKYEILEQSMLEEAKTSKCLFLRREFLVMDTIWKRCPRQLVGFPAVFDYGYVGDKLQYGINQKYKETFYYINLKGEEVNFYSDILNRNLEGITKISYMTMELLGPSIDDIRSYYDPWYSQVGLKTFFQVPTVFKIADQFLCRLLVLHKCGFVHHDLKPDNIALGHGRAMNTIYLLDFGFAKQVSSVRLSDWMGSRKFISVENFSGGTANYGQDIESWFYVICSLLFDHLPWAEEMLQQDLGPNTDELAKWERMLVVKRCWWDDTQEFGTLNSFFDSVEKLHSGTVPDIRRLMEMLHKRVRELRHTMLQIDDAATLNSDLNNTQSYLFKGYMGIRKILMLIFDLPKTSARNHLVFDAEYQALYNNRKNGGGVFFPFSPGKFFWEWDENHSTIVQKNDMEANRSLPLSVNNSDLGGDDQLFLGNNSDRLLRMLARQGGAALSSSRDSATVINSTGRLRRHAPDEVSYVFDSKTKTFMPKGIQWRSARWNMQF